MEGDAEARIMGCHSGAESVIEYHSLCGILLVN